MASNTSLTQALKDGVIVEQDCTVDEAEASLGRVKKFLADLTNPKNSLSIETRFNLAYDTAHGFLQVALRMMGYRTANAPGHRAVLFEILPILVPGAAASKDSLAHAHGLRNRLEYDSYFEVPTSVVDDMVEQVKSVAEEVIYAFKKFKAAEQPPPVPAPSSGQKKSGKAPLRGCVLGRATT